MKENKPKILVLFYSMYGHIFRMANAVVEGVREAGGEAILKQVAKLIPEEFWDENIKKVKEIMEDIPVANPREDLKGIDGIIIGTPTRFGNMCAQMRNFWDQTGGLDARCSHWQTSVSVHQLQYATWRTRNYYHHDYDHAFTSWLCFGRSTLLFQRADDNGRNNRWLTVRSFDYCWRDGRAHAIS